MVEGTLGRHLAPTLVKARLTLGQDIQANPSISKRRGITDSLGDLLKCLTTLVLKTFFLIHHLLQLVPAALPVFFRTVELRK